MFSFISLSTSFDYFLSFGFLCLLVQPVVSLFTFRLCQVCVFLSLFQWLRFCFILGASVSCPLYAVMPHLLLLIFPCRLHFPNHPAMCICCLSLSLSLIRVSAHFFPGVFWFTPSFVIWRYIFLLFFVFCILYHVVGQINSSLFVKLSLH